MILKNLEEKAQIQRLCWLPVVHCARAQLAWSLDEEQFSSDNSNLLKFQSLTSGYKHYETLASQVREWIEVMWWWLRECSYWSCQRDQPLCHGGGQCQQATSECYKPEGVKRPFSTRLWDYSSAIKMKPSQFFILLLSSFEAYAFENSLERYREREQNVRHGKSKLQSLKRFMYYYNCLKIDAPKFSACETVISQLAKNPLHLENYKFATWKFQFMFFSRKNE